MLAEVVHLIDVFALQLALAAVEIEEAISEFAEQPFDAVEFPFQFLECFGNKPTTLKRLRSGNSNNSDVDHGVLQRSNIHLATCATGATASTLELLRGSPATAKAKATLAAVYS